MGKLNPLSLPLGKGENQLVLIQGNHTISNCMCFSRIVRDPDDGGLPASEALDEPSAYSQSSGQVEVRERLIQQKNRRAADQAPTKGDSLPLTSGEFRRESLQVRFQLEERNRFVQPLAEFGRFRSRPPELTEGIIVHPPADGQVLSHIQMGNQGRMLENHADRVLLAGNLGGEGDRAGSWLLQACDKSS